MASRTPQQILLEDLHRFRIEAHAVDGSSIYVPGKGQLSIPEAALYVHDLMRRTEPDQLAADVVALRLIGELVACIEECHLALREGIRAFNCQRIAPPQEMQAAIHRSLPALERARGFAPAPASTSQEASIG